MGGILIDNLQHRLLRLDALFLRVVHAVFVALVIGRLFSLFKNIQTLYLDCIQVIQILMHER